MQRLLTFLVHSHIFIGLCAAAITAQTLFVIEQNPFRHLPLLGLVFFGTMALYSLHRYVQSKAYAQVADARVLQLLHFRAVYIIFFIIGLAAACLLFYLHFLDRFFAFLWPALLGGLYVVPWTRQWRRFRDLPYLKIFLITVCWVWITLLLPMDLQQIKPGGLGWMALERGFFLLAITLPFDIRDLFADRSVGLKTLATALGEGSVRRLALALILVTILICGYLKLTGIYELKIFISYLLAYLFALVLIYRSTSKRNERFYSIGLDGTLIIPMLGMIVLNFEF